MAEALALTYRPRSFDDLVGQKPIQVVLRQMVNTRQVHHALLFDGPKGTGKTTTARLLAAALNCETPPVTASRPCGHCVSCKNVFNGTSLDVIEVDAASHGLVDDIRHLCTHIMYRQTGAYRVVILDEAHCMSPEAGNALLKTAEDPPPDTVFILLTTRPTRILDTIVSRCMPFTFRRIPPADIAARLAHISHTENRPADPDLLHLIAERADGGLRDAIMIFDQVTRAGIHTAAAYTDLFGHPNHAPDLLTHLAAGDLPAAYTTLNDALSRTGDPAALITDLITVLRDILIIHAGATPTCAQPARATRTHLATQLDTTITMAALRLLWDMPSKTRAIDDPRARLDLAVALLADTIARHKPANPPTATPTRKITLSEMAARR